MSLPEFVNLEIKPIALNSFSKNKDQAWELIKFICSKDEVGMWLTDSGSGWVAPNSSLGAASVQAAYARFH
jgi:spermidine/putrescine-binding protein